MPREKNAHPTKGNEDRRVSKPSDSMLNSPREQVFPSRGCLFYNSIGVCGRQ